MGSLFAYNLSIANHERILYISFMLFINSFPTTDAVPIFWTEYDITLYWDVLIIISCYYRGSPVAGCIPSIVNLEIVITARFFD